MAKSLDELSIRLLRQIRDGQRSFTPRDDSAMALEEFQEKARALRTLEAKSYFREIIRINMMTKDGQPVITNIDITNGGLTGKGYAAINERREDAAA